MNDFQIKLFDRFEMKSLDELSWFLKISVIRNRNVKKVWLSQKFYIEKLISKFDISLNSKASDSSLFVIYFSINQND